MYLHQRARILQDLCRQLACRPHLHHLLQIESDHVHKGHMEDSDMCDIWMPLAKPQQSIDPRVTSSPIHLLPPPPSPFFHGALPVLQKGYIRKHLWRVYLLIFAPGHLSCVHIGRLPYMAGHLKPWGNRVGCELPSHLGHLCLLLFPATLPLSRNGPQSSCLHMHSRSQPSKQVP